MKELCGCFEPQSLSRSVIQSVINNFNFLISDRGHESFFGDVLAQQNFEILIASALPAGKWSGKVGGALKLFIKWAIAQRPSVGDLSPAVSSHGIAFLLLLLTAQVLPKNPTQSLVRINMLIKSFMAVGQLRGNLLRGLH